jgi:glutathione S-transferase
MIKVHHLNFSRSTRILWLLEELGVPYEVVPHTRDPMTLRAPPSLKAVHPLGKAPVIEDGELMIAESGAAIEYLVEAYGGGALAPSGRGADWARYIEWLHYAEGSAMLAPLVGFLGGVTGGLSPGLKGFVDAELKLHLDHISTAIDGGGWLMGDLFTGADIQLFYVLEIAAMIRALDGHPAVRAYLERCRARPAFRRAIEVGGPVALPVG